MVSSKMAVRNGEKQTIINNNNNNASRQPLHVIAANVAATRVQPPRQAKKNQKTATTTSFDIFVDEKVERNKKQNAGQTKTAAVRQRSVNMPVATSAATSA